MTQENSRAKYHHPYSPYKIQLDFMESMYDLMTNGYKIGLFESPTGTGKTLSLICSTITWLREVQAKSDESLTEEDESDDEPSWVKESYSKIVNSKRTHAAVEYEKNLDNIAKGPLIKMLGDAQDPKVKRFKKVEVEIADEDQQFLPDDYHSDDEVEQHRMKDRNADLGQEIKKLMKKLDAGVKEDSKILDQKIKVYFSSRTHSQLNQFSSQLRLPDFPSSYTEVKEHLKYLPLGSRKQLCIHEKVSKISDSALMNEACLEVQKPDSTTKCEFYPAMRDDDMQERAIEFRDSVFAEIRDIEDLSKLGENLRVCPYYSVRKGIGYSEVITLPYQLLLSKKSRDSLGISLKGSIVVIDEAHNLLDTITSIHSISVTVQEFELCRDSLKKYLSKFTRRMNGGNRVNLMKLLKIINIILKYAGGVEQITPGKPIDLIEMLRGTTGDLLNIHKLDKYLTVSKIAYKIESYMEKNDRHQTPILFKVVDFLKSISNPSKEGKFFFDVKATLVSLNYMLLDPSEVFREIVDDAKCIILAGGTMEPTEDYYNYLFPYVEENKIKKFTCGHVIPKENLDVFVIDRYRTEFEFSFDKRNDLNMITGLGESIVGLIEKIPGGVVVFLPSYKYLEQITHHWKKCGVYSRIESEKKIFSESSTTNVLEEYSNEISNGKGALLLSVVGGRLSEGINFSDDLARAVMLIGLPFPNAFSGEIVSKRKFIEDQVISKTKDRGKAMDATRNFYNNICMRAVNQSVGRSIRHRNDYATIYLFDKRYRTERIENKLSDWIRQRIIRGVDYREIVEKTDEFFRRR
jgi:chromosome transmission fidelity protein 1